MNQPRYRQLFWWLLILLFLWPKLKALAINSTETRSLQDLRDKAPRVFLDCIRCDVNYIKTEIPFVNFVRDPKEADVHILVTTQLTGSGGTEYTLTFIGQGSHSKCQNVLTYVSDKTKTEEEIRAGYTRILKMGLMPYLAPTPLAEQCSISFRQVLPPTIVTDSWNFWVFGLSLGGRFDGESKRKASSINANLSANRVTPEFKIRLGFNANFEERRYLYSDKTIISSTESESFSGLVVKSLSDHWSVGGYLNMSSSVYNNIKFSLNPAPAIEYNVFPYSESTRRELRFLYRIGFNAVSYREETIYFKTAENLWSQSLTATLELKEPWGSWEASIRGSHYFHDFSKNRLRLSSRLYLRLFKGLAVGLNGYYDRVRDQLSLRRGEATLEEVLLRRTQLETSYEYSLSVTLNYSFGSIFSNVVNPRFGEY
ncbi:MAG: hypothetical protein N3B16_09845 [Candidatus Aminicenantes bacterium]|nr:hypothetical protein [Candidatus Aminicenantes bacterium]